MMKTSDALRTVAEKARQGEWERAICLDGAKAIERMETELYKYRALGTVEELAALKEQTRWIPVSERLPKYGPNKGAEAYWIAKKTRNGEWQIKIALYSDYGYATTVDIPENVTWRDYDFCQITNVAYWMPLPEAPKETDHE